MATHSSILAWRIPGMGEPGGLPSMGSQSRTRLKRLSSSSSNAVSASLPGPPNSWGDTVDGEDGERWSRACCGLEATPGSSAHSLI